MSPKEQENLRKRMMARAKQADALRGKPQPKGKTKVWSDKKEDLVFVPSKKSD